MHTFLLYANNNHMTEKLDMPPEFRINEKYEEDFKQLRKVLDIIKSIGLTPTGYSDEIIQNQWDMGNTFPIVREGADGIRVTRSRRGGITVSFTNGFENPKDPKRMEVTEELRKSGIDVV